jgi:thioredoxin reductase
MEETVSYDVVVVGGGAAGLSAALVLGRSRRRTLVLDAGEPRNAPSSGVGGFFSRDGIPPKDLLEIGREQLAPYPSVELRPTRATDAGGEDGAFEVTLADGSRIRARKIVLATGVVDELPETPGFRELWGRGVYHCPYCHGWEVRDRPIAVHASGEATLERAVLIRNWSRDLVVCSDGPLGLDEAGRGKLAALGIGVREGRISRLEGGDGSLRRIVFEDGTHLAREALFYPPPQRQRSDLAEALGCELEEAGPALVVKNDPTTRETTVPASPRPPVPTRPFSPTTPWPLRMQRMQPQKPGAPRRQTSRTMPGPSGPSSPVPAGSPSRREARSRRAGSR